MQLAILFGERSYEHDISVITAQQFLEAIDLSKYQAIPVYVDKQGYWWTGKSLWHRSNQKISTKNLKPACLTRENQQSGLTINKQFIPIDIFIPLFHGSNGEDGRIQALLDLHNCCYTGSSMASSNLTIDKWISKSICRDCDIPVLDGQLISQKTFSNNQIPAIKFEYPIIVKPRRLGSSLGISVALNKSQLQTALAKVFQMDTHAILEPYIANRMELNIAVLDDIEPKLSAIEVPISNNEILTFEDKYNREEDKTGSNSTSGSMESMTRVINPPHLPQELKAQIKTIALKAFEVFECSGTIRIDFLYDCNTQSLYLNEINSLPGSVSFYLWAEANPPISYPQLIDKLIESAIRHYRYQLRLIKSF